MAVKLKVKVGDTVKVISGEDKNKKDNTGKVQKVFPETGRIIVEGINMGLGDCKKSLARVKTVIRQRELAGKA